MVDKKRKGFVGGLANAPLYYKTTDAAAFPFFDGRGEGVVHRKDSEKHILLERSRYFGLSLILMFFKGLCILAAFISNSGHPMAGGLSGTVQVTVSNTKFAWGKPNANAAKIATLTSDSTKATDFGYASGSVMPGLTAPAARVGFFYTASSSALTTNGGVLFDNAIKWAAGL